MITNLVGPITQNSDTLNGIRRSRFSWHFNTTRRRRWLLVQLVSAPAIPAVEEDNSCPSPHVHTKQPGRGLSDRIEEYGFNRIQRALI
jgi:hypothetical protein